MLSCSLASPDRVWQVGLREGAWASPFHGKNTLHPNTAVFGQQLAARANLA